MLKITTRVKLWSSVAIYRARRITLKRAAKKFPPLTHLAIFERLLSVAGCCPLERRPNSSAPTPPVRANLSASLAVPFSLNGFVPLPIVLFGRGEPFRMMGLRLSSREGFRDGRHDRFHLRNIRCWRSSVSGAMVGFWLDLLDCRSPIGLCRNGGLRLLLQAPQVALPMPVCAWGHKAACHPAAREAQSRSRPPAYRSTGTRTA